MASNDETEQVTRWRHKIIILNMEEYKKDKKKLKTEIDSLYIQENAIMIRFTANNLMIYLEKENDLNKIVKNDAIFPNKIKKEVIKKAKITLVIKGLTFNEARDNQEKLSELGITQIINLQTPKKDSNELETSNDSLTKKVMRTELNIVGINCEDETTEIKLKKAGIYLEYMRYKVEDYIRPIRVLQCHNCNKFNHKARECQNEQACLKCGENHSYKQCNVMKDKLRCVNCNGNHAATSKECLQYKNHKRELTETKENENRKKKRNEENTVRNESNNPNPIKAVKSPVKSCSIEHENILQKIFDSIKDNSKKQEEQDAKINKHYVNFLAEQNKQSEIIKNLENRITSFSSQINTISGKEDNNRKQIASMKADLDNLSTQITTLHESNRKDILSIIVDCHNAVHDKKIDERQLNDICRKDRERRGVNQNSSSKIVQISTGANSSIAKTTNK